MYKSYSYYNINNKNFENPENNEFYIEALYDFNYNSLTRREIRIIQGNCSYICDICKNDYMYSCFECELTKDFEFEIEKQKYIEYIKRNERIINRRKYKNKNESIKKYNYKKNR